MDDLGVVGRQGRCARFPSSNGCARFGFGDAATKCCQNNTWDHLLVLDAEPCLNGGAFDQDHLKASVLHIQRRPEAGHWHETLITCNSLGILALHQVAQLFRGVGPHGGPRLATLVDGLHEPCKGKLVLIPVPVVHVGPLFFEPSQGQHTFAHSDVSDEVSHRPD